MSTLVRILPSLGEFRVSKMDVRTERGESCNKCHPLFSPDVIRINIADSFCKQQRFPTASVVDATSGAWMWRSASPCLDFFIFLLFLFGRRGRRRTSFAPLHSFGSIRDSQPGVWRFSFRSFTIQRYSWDYFRVCFEREVKTGVTIQVIVIS